MVNTVEKRCPLFFVVKPCRVMTDVKTTEKSDMTLSLNSLVLTAPIYEIIATLLAAILINHY